MVTIDQSLCIKGELRTTDDVTIEGRIEGHLICEGCAVVLGPTSDVSGQVLAGDVTVFGRLSGQVIATEVVDIRAEARVTAQVVAKRFILDESADFRGRVEPQHLEAALRVSRFQQRKRLAIGG